MTKVGWSVFGVLATAVAGFVALTGQPGEPLSTPVQSFVAPAQPTGVPGSGFAVPVAGINRAALTDSWHDARGERQHEGLDIMAPAGTNVVAAMPGIVEKLFESRLGGTTLYIRSLDRRTVAYYAHLAGYAPGIVEGIEVARGQHIGYVGDTGSGSAGNPHLHFALNRMARGDKWYDGEPVNPYPLLAGPSLAGPSLAGQPPSR